MQDVKIIATKMCAHCANLVREFKDLGVDCEVLFIEDHPGLVEQHAIRHSPNVMIDGQVVCRGQPTTAELRTLLTQC